MPTDDAEHRRANHYHLLNIALGGGRRFLPILLLGPLVVFVAAISVLLFLFPRGGQGGDIATSFATLPLPLFVLIPTVLLVCGLMYVVWAPVRMRRAMLNALQSSNPEVLAGVVSKKLSSHLPDSDALAAQARALAFAIFGRAQEARLALRKVDWSSKAPLVQALHHYAEAWVSLLCDRNIPRARTQFHQAHAKSLVNPHVPGAATAERTYETALLVCDVLSGQTPPDATTLLQGAIAHHPSPYTRLLAAMALAQLFQGLGDSDRADQLREYIASTAPHCEPLRLAPADFTSSAEPHEGQPDLSLPTALTAAPSPDPQSTFAKRIRFLAVLWLALIIAFVAIWQLLTPR